MLLCSPYINQKTFSLLVLTVYSCLLATAWYISFLGWWSDVSPAIFCASKQSHANNGQSLLLGLDMYLVSIRVNGIAA